MKASVFRGTEGSLKSRVLSFEREHLYPLEPGSQLFFFLYHEQRPNFRLGCFHPIFFCFCSYRVEYGYLPNYLGSVKSQ